MTSHNSFFGWVHFFKVNSNNILINGVTNIGLQETPYPPIISAPTINQILNNWNRADTGLFLSTMLVGTILAFPAIKSTRTSHNFLKRRNFAICMAFTAFGAISFALMNSSYRLEGLVPNGLKAHNVVEPLKYNLTGPFLQKSSLLSLIFEKPKKPLNVTQN